MPNILKGGDGSIASKKADLYRIWPISSGVCLRPLIVRSPSARQLIVNQLCNPHGSPKQSTEVVDKPVEKAEAGCEL
jgi:hypothetical protein